MELKPPAFGMNTADQCRAMGLAVGDIIVGRETYGDEWSESRLELLFVGESVAVFREYVRNNYGQPEWRKDGESGNWTLNCKQWSKL